MTIKEAKEICNKFALKHKVIFEEEGSIGFGRDCVGFTKGSSYIAYCPYRTEPFGSIKNLHDDRLYDIAAKNSYHKDTYIAVLINEEVNLGAAIVQLAKWVTELEELKCEVVEYNTGATGLQAAFTGVTGYAVKIGA